MNIIEWAARWGIPLAALVDLAAQFTVGHNTAGEFRSESGVQSVVRLEAAQAGKHLWRNNVGVLEDRTGRPVRYGLANDSPALNKRLKSADLIGWESVPVASLDPRGNVARFLSVECKEPGWRFNPNNEREQAQHMWAALVNNAGGRAVFATGRGAL